MGFLVVFGDLLAVVVVVFVVCRCGRVLAVVGILVDVVLFRFLEI